LVGRVLGARYRLTRRLGQGAFAQVYAADDVRLRRRVAIKVLHPALADDQSFLRRFTAEAQAVANLRHPHILRVYDWGDDDGDPYLVMELLAGGSLRSYLDGGQLLSLSQAARVGADVASALDYAHRHGLVHRDIKPANLIFDDEGRITVADFGLARALADATLTEPVGTVVGTARYAAPEQIRGNTLDDRADIYSLALVLVEAITGDVPFARDTTLATLLGRVDEPVPVGAHLGPLSPVIEAAGSVLSADRPDAGRLARALEAAAAVLPPPVPLLVAGPLANGWADQDDPPTEIPGRPGLFDIEAVDGAAPPGSLREALGARTGDGPVVVDEPVVVDDPVADDQVVVDDSTLETRLGASTPLAPTWSDSDADDPGPPLPGRWGNGAPADRDDLFPPPPPSPKSRTRRSRWRRVLLALVVVIALAGGAAGGYVAYESTRPAPKILVPVVSGRTVAAARAALLRLHLTLAVAGETYSSTGAPGTILSQVPGGGRLPRGGVVSVVVSRGPQPVKVPALGGKTEAEAKGVISAVGLRVGAVTKATSLTVPAGSVISEHPDGGTLLPGQSVELVVSTGKPMVAVPALSGANALSYAAAQAALSAVGLTATEVDSYDNIVGVGQVIGTNPGPGTSVVVGTSVIVEISKGPHLVAVPNVAQNSVTTASQMLAAAGFSVSGVTGNPTATVTGSVPSAGTSELYGSSVQLVTG
jgi:serine/threonine-protein kinase